MKQKAAIDILDLPLTDDTADIPEIETDAASEVPQAAEAKERDWRWLFNRWYWLVGALFVIVIAGIVIWLAWGDKPGAAKPLRQVATDAERPAPGKSLAVLDHFVIDLIDEKGSARLLLCGFLLEVNSPEHARAVESRTDIRAFIYDTIHKRSARELKIPDTKRVLKKEIAEGLNPLLGADKVKSVYISQFLIL